jgi:hypothetical protein
MNLQDRIGDILKSWISSPDFDSGDYPEIAKAILALVEKPVEPTADSEGGFETFDSFFAGLPMHKERDAMRLYEAYISDYIRQTIATVRREERERAVKILEGMKLDPTFNSSWHKENCKGYNEGLSDAITAITGGGK